MYEGRGDSEGGDGYRGEAHVYEYLSKLKSGVQFHLRVKY